MGLPECTTPCQITRDRSLVRRAAALLFHFDDIRLNDMPTFRDERQIWIFFTHEPTTLVPSDWSRFEHVFNWTMSYRSDSDVFWPYSSIRPVYSPRHVELIDIQHKRKFAFAAVSNKYAYSKRYRILHKLSKINPSIDLFGKDYGNKCEINTIQCLRSDSLKQYFFKLALENSHCKDYVTEKFWSILKFNLIPIVDWAPTQRTNNIPPNSYINIKDFYSLNDLNDYLIKVTKDPILFNSYFEWKRNFTLYDEGPCNLCNAMLIKPIKKQILDIEAWLQNDICSPWTRSAYRKIVLDRQLFDKGM